MHELAINPIIYAELSLSYESIETLDARVADLKLALLELPRAADAADRLDREQRMRGL